MPKVVHFKVLLSKHVGFPPPEVRIWIDVDDDSRLIDAEEVSLEQDDLKWSGSKAILADSTTGLWFFVAAIATVGAKLSVTVATDSEFKEIVCKDETKVNSQRFSVWGVCS